MFNEFLDLGASYGTAKSGVGISSMGVLKPELIFKSIVPIIMAGILGIYGLIVSVILQGRSKNLFNRRIPKLTYSIVDPLTYTYDKGYKHLASGLCCGLSSLVRDLKG
jgi:V-type H+-transporting ATPase proteolipid subunit